MAKQVTIIGGGLAATAAALAAKSQGAEVTLVSGRPGASALASGAWDVALADEAVLRAEQGIPGSPREGLLRYVKAKPQHPYKHLAAVMRGQDLASVMETALDSLRDAMPYRVEGSLDETLALLTPLGSVKYTAWADPAQAAGNILKWRKAHLLVAGIPGLALFPVPLIEKVLNESTRPAHGRKIEKVTATQLDITGVTQHSLSPFALAQRLEDEDTFSALTQHLKKQVQQHRATHVMLPPVIGLHQAPVLLQRLSKAVGALCFESLATAPSVPGLRRHQALQAALKSSGACILEGWVESFEADQQIVKELTLRGAEREHLFDLGSIVLASGRFIGGGIAKQDQLEETLFKSPVAIRGQLVEDRFVGQWLERSALAPHDLFLAGTQVNESLQPLNRWGEPMYNNLYAAGSVIGGYAATSEGCGSGVALLSGWIAGLKGAA